MNNIRILLLGHGSKAQGATQGMNDIAEQIASRFGIQDLVVCQMEGLGLNLQEAIAQAYEQGIRTILVQPYFLHAGNHLRLDIPEMLDEARVKFPDMQLHLGRHLGVDPALADLVHRRIQESLQDLKQN